MWQRFTEDARRVILLSQQEAMRAQSSYVDTEHLLLGLFAWDERRINFLLERMGINAPAVRAEVEKAVAQYPQSRENKEPALTRSAKRALELAASETRQAGHAAVRVEYLLLALIRHLDGKAWNILIAQGAELEKARRVVKEEVARGEQTSNSGVKSESDIQFGQGVTDVLQGAWQRANPSQGDIGTEQLLLSLLERREDLLVEILGLDVLALKKARLKLLIRLDLYEEAVILRDEIENEHS